MHHRVDRMCRADYSPAPSRRDDLSAVRERLVGRLQHPHHAQAGPAVVERLLSRGHTVQKVASFELEGLGLVHAWCPHVSAPVAHQKVVDRLLCSHLEDRSEEHTSELQSRLHLVCRLLLEKKKTSKAINIPYIMTRTPGRARQASPTNQSSLTQLQPPSVLQYIHPRVTVRQSTGVSVTSR